MKKAFGLIILIFAFYSCSKHIPAEYEVVGMSLSNANNTGQDPFDAGGDSVPIKAYAIKITLNEEMRKKSGGDAQENGFINEDRLTSLNVSSLNNFDATHPAGSSLNTYFLTGLSSSATLDQFISKGNIGGGVYKDNNYTDSWSTNQYLYLMSKPSAGNYQSFVVEMSFSDNRTLRDTVKVKLY